MADRNNNGPDRDFPDKIGPYRILDQLGEGGMAVVYLAEQSEPIQRRVALKILKPGMDSKQVVARFESERQALAVLDHPNIATVFDGGLTESGRPYFVMELVHGIPITDYCDDHRLSTDDRMRLFVDVCSAVQHAHHKGLIHRDLKPSNILVGVVDGKPSPKIIDFGIAKATSMNLTERTLVTRIGQMIGTPQYMSPEQAALTGLDVDTRADIYSLGVVLYELLIGVPPLDLTAIGEQAMKHALLEKDPSKPSTRVSELGDTKEEIANARHTDVGALRRQLAGDLDWVVMHAIEKDRTRRYETANAFAMDCKRYLRHEPVLARPPNTAYVLSRFIRRNRATVVAASIAIVAVIGGTVAATIGYVRASEAERVALQEADTANRISDFLVELFQVSDPSEARGNSVTAREILDRGAETIKTSLTDEPEVQARLALTIGLVYRSLGLLTEADELMQVALELQRSLATGPDRKVAYLLNELAALKIYQGDYAAAKMYGTEALEMQRTLFGDAHEDVGQTLSNLATVEYYDSNYAEAIELFQESLDAFENSIGVDHEDAINTASSLGSVYWRTGNMAESERLLKQALERRRRVSGDDHPDVAVMMGNLAILLKDQGRIDEAEPYYIDSLELQQRQLGTHHLVANTMNNVGMFYLGSGKLDEAETMLKNALDMWVQTLGTANAKSEIARHNLGLLYLNKGDLETAELFLDQALIGRLEIFGEEHESPAMTRVFLADIYWQSNRAAEGEAMMQGVVALLEEKLPAGHIRIVSARLRLGACLAANGQFEAGEAMILENLQILEDRQPESTAYRRLRRWAADFYRWWDMPAEAQKYTE